MCSPFSAAFWQKSWNSYQSVEPIRGSSPLQSIDEEDTLFDRDGESFRLFSSPKEILGHSWRESLAEKLPLWKRPTHNLVHWPSCRFQSSAGLILTVASGILFAIASLFVKLSNTTIPAFEIVFVRLVTQTLLVLPVAIWARADLLGEKKYRPFLLCFGVVNFASISCIYSAFTELPLGDATVCISATPIFTAFLAYVFLKESWHIFDAVATFTCVGGVVLITRPTFIFGSAGTMFFFSFGFH